jgi:hypothetical protein
MLSVFSLPKVYQPCRHIPVMTEKLGHRISQITISKKLGQSGRICQREKKIASLCLLVHMKLHNLAP